MNPAPSAGARAGAMWSGGLFGGSLVGLAEAARVLSLHLPSEYQALPYAVVLYGAFGLGVAFLPGLLYAALARGPWARGLGWSLGFLGAAVPLFAAILDATASRELYAEGGVPGGVRGMVGGALVLGALAATWPLTVVLTRTPLRVLPGFKASATAWGLLLGLALLFSLAEPPVAPGNYVPRRAQESELTARPDILLLHVDTLRYDAATTPALRALAADAVWFEQHITPSSWTRPSLASLFTSLPPASHGCQTKASSLSDAVDTLAEVLGRAGYATGGLPNNANVTASLGFSQGFDYYPFLQRWMLGARESTFTLSLYAALRREVARRAVVHRPEEHYVPADQQLDRALAYIDAQAGDRYFLYVHLMDPHDPYFVHPWTGEATTRAGDPTPANPAALRDRYLGEVAWLDAQLASFFAVLRQRGWYDELLLVLWSDHGEELGDHGGSWHGQTLYEEVVHTPLVVKLPGNARGGRRIPWPVRTIDVAPTVVDLANVASSPRWRGENLFPDDLDETVPEVVRAGPWRAPDPWASPYAREGLGELSLEGRSVEMLRVDGYKVLRSGAVGGLGDRRVELYDLRVDPHEQANLADGAQELPWVARLDRALEQARATAGWVP